MDSKITIETSIEISVCPECGDFPYAYHARDSGTHDVYVIDCNICNIWVEGDTPATTAILWNSHTSFK